MRLPEIEHPGAGGRTGAEWVNRVMINCFDNNHFPLENQVVSTESLRGGYPNDYR